MSLQKSTHLWGIRWWALWYPTGMFVPKFDVCSYEGYDPDSGLYYFCVHKKKGIIVKSLSQIEVGIFTNSFKPFLLNIPLVEKYVNKEMP